MENPEKILAALRKRILKSALDSGEGHIPTSFSILEILYVYYAKQVEIFGSIATSPNRLVLSKGHAAIGLYAVLEHFELIPVDWLDNFCKFNSPLGGHPDMTKIDCVEASTGSLGHGLPIGIGLSLGSRILDKLGMTYVLVGDGELNEGSNWESFLVAAQHNLSNLTVIVDWNQSCERSLSVGDLESKFKSFGFDAEVIDGHSHADLDFYFSQETTNLRAPRALLAKTIKGKGIAQMEDNPQMWHHKPLTYELFIEMVEQLN